MLAILLYIGREFQKNILFEVYNKIEKLSQNLNEFVFQKLLCNLLD